MGSRAEFGRLGGQGQIVHVLCGYPSPLGDDFLFHLSSLSQICIHNHLLIANTTTHRNSTSPPNPPQSTSSAPNSASVAHAASKSSPSKRSKRNPSSIKPTPRSILYSARAREASSPSSLRGSRLSSYSATLITRSLLTGMGGVLGPIG